MTRLSLSTTSSSLSVNINIIVVGVVWLSSLFSSTTSSCCLASQVVYCQILQMRDGAMAPGVIKLFAFEEAESKLFAQSFDSFDGIAHALDGIISS